MSSTGYRHPDGTQVKEARRVALDVRAGLRRPDGRVNLTGPRAAGTPEQWPAGARAWWLGTVSLVLTVTAVSSRYLSPDSFYDLYAGRYVIHHGFPHTNVFTAVAHGAGWMDQQWLAQAAYYGAWAAGGYPALAALSALLVTSGFAILALIMLRRGVPPSRAFAWTLAAFIACLGSTPVWAQSFGYLFFALTLWLLAGDLRSPRLRPRTWLILPILAAWANTHGSVLLGAGLTGLYATYRAAAALARHQHRSALAYLTLGATAAATITCTPYGPAIITGYYTHLIANPVLGSNVLWWVPPSLAYPYCWPFFALVAVVVAAVGFAWRRGARPDPVLAALAAVLLAQAATGIRFQAWFAFGGVLLAADTLARAGHGRAPAFSAAFTRALTATLATVAAASLAVLALTPAGTFESTIPARAINAAAAIAAANPHTRILGDDLSGSPMLWLHPATRGRVAYDARLEQYSSAELSAYYDFVFVRGPHWQRVTDGYGIIVVSRRQHPRLARALGHLPGWRIAYRDSTGLVAVRRQPGTPAP